MAKPVYLYSYILPTEKVRLPNTIEDTLDAVAFVMKEEKEIMLLAVGRKRENVKFRQLTWKLLSEIDGQISKRKMAEIFRLTNHSTVIHGIVSITYAMTTDDELRNQYEAAKRLLEYYYSPQKEY